MDTLGGSCVNTYQTKSKSSGQGLICLGLGFLVLLASARGVRAAGADNGVPPPIAPEVIRRANGTATLRAVRLTDPLTVDGRLDEQIYTQVPALTDFFQTIPDTGQPASQKTEAWIFFDGRAIYVSARCWDTRPPDAWTANEMRRDQIGGQDTFGVSFDTFHDRRNSFIFYTNPLAAQSDTVMTNETGANHDYNPVWDLKTGRFDGGWTVEMRIPFKALRYGPGASQVWGVQLRRTVRQRNEFAFLTPLPAAVGAQGLSRVSLAPALYGLEVPSGSKNLEIKPYAISTLTTDRVARPPVSRDVSGDVGLDVKYGLTENLTADFTYNTDVAAAEADDQQVNLTRFNLSLAEKRDFFLENQGIFAFGAAGPALFYSRQIGLLRGRAVPIIAGGRLTGHVGRTTLGLLNIQTGDEAVSKAKPTNFTVLRVRQDVLRRSTIGAMYTNRSESIAAPGKASPASGVDGSFAFYENLSLNASYAHADTPRATGKDAYTAALVHDPDTWGFSATHLFVADGFNPEVGFVKRDDIRQTALTGRFSPRPQSVRHVEQFSLTGAATYTLNASNVLESRNETVGFRTEFENADSISVGASRDYDRLFVPFRIATGITIPVGAYTFTTVRGSYTRGSSRRISGTASFDDGGFYNGHDSTLGYSGRIAVTPLLSVSPSISVHWIDLPYGSFVSQLHRARIIYTVTPRMFISGLVQYNTSTHTIGTNVRLRWEYQQGSELFVVYNENQHARPVAGGFAELLDRSFAVKINRLLRF